MIVVCCKKFSIRKPTENILELIIFFIHMMYIFFTGEEVAIIHLLAGPHIVVALVTHHHHILGPPLRPRSPAPRRARQPASGPAPAGAWPRGRGRWGLRPGTALGRRTAEWRRCGTRAARTPWRRKPGELYNGHQYQLFFFDFPLLLYPLLLIRHVVSIYSNISNAIKTTKCDKSSQIKCREDIWENMLRTIQG